MHAESCSGCDLLAMLAGDAFADQCRQKSLVELFGYAKTSVTSDTVCEATATYPHPEIHPSLAAAKELLVRYMAQRMSTENDLFFNGPEIVKAFLTGKLGHLEHEVFSVLFLDNSHRVLAYEILFRGTINACHVQVREVVKMALQYNAAAIILAHNHPSKSDIPSASDIAVTRKLTSALEVVDIKVLDHIIVAGNLTASMQEMGMM
ncbi:JAB domain-containing protein [Acidithiobacillus ferrooxidans]|uniref:JAB domain-containing protein n=1 Tax=Acidithiobacillus ferrooxidans TaxID=920 RepID=UPI000AC20065|nr:JAB domain-containing protein [Acidithiobacillus ferrooxidans]